MTAENQQLQCWKCGNPLQNFEYPYSRHEECSGCNADLHACLLCRHYDQHVADACREDRADSIQDKDRANFCDYFKPRPQAHVPRDEKANLETKAKLAALFGDELPGQDLDPARSVSASEADSALAELKRLFDDE